MIYIYLFLVQLANLISLQRYTKALSSQQRTMLVEKSRQKPQDRMRVVTDVGLLSSVQILQLLVDFPLLLTYAIYRQ